MRVKKAVSFSEILQASKCNRKKYLIQAVAVGRTAKGRVALNVEVWQRRETKAPECQRGAGGRGSGGCLSPAESSCPCSLAVPGHYLMFWELLAQVRGQGQASQGQGTGDLALIQTRKRPSPSTAPSPGTRHAESSVCQPHWACGDKGKVTRMGVHFKR